jgi:hypothetical protein
MNQPVSGEYVSDFGARSSTEESHGCAALKQKEGEKMSDFWTLFSCHHLSGEEH